MKKNKWLFHFFVLIASVWAQEFYILPTVAQEFSNPEFEKWDGVLPTGWSIRSEAELTNVAIIKTFGKDGDCPQFTINAKNPCEFYLKQQSSLLKQNGNYEISAWVKASKAQACFLRAFGAKDGKTIGDPTTSQLNKSQDWEKLTVKISTSSNQAIMLYLIIRANKEENIGAQILVDNIELKKGVENEQPETLASRIASMPKEIDGLRIIDTTSFIVEENSLGHAAFLKTLQRTGCEQELLGQARGLDIMALKLGDLEKKPVILIFNQHGAEWSAPHVIRDFMQYLHDNNSPEIKFLRENVAFFAIPSACPWGYENKQYLLDNGVNPNRNWDNNWEGYDAKGTRIKGSAPWSEPEVRLLRDKILELQPFMVIDCHTSTGPGFDTGKIYKTWRPLLKPVHDAMSNFTSRIQMEWSTGTSPSSVGWSGKQQARDGLSMIPSLIEFDNVNPQQAHFYGINALFRLCHKAANARVTVGDF